MLYCTYNLFNIFRGTYTAHHQERQSSSFPHPGRIACYPAPYRRPPATKALHTICANNKRIVSRSWWQAYKCPKHVQQIISAINHSVAPRWFSSPRLYNDERTNIHQIHCSGLGQGKVDGSCECGNENSGYINCGGFLDQLRTICCWRRAVFHGTS